MDDSHDHSVRAIALAVTAGVFLGGVATGVAFPTLPLLDQYLGISAALLGFILSANRIARLVANTPAGNVIDRVGPRRPMIVGLFVQGLAPFGYVLGLNVPRVDLFVLPAVGTVSLPALVFISARIFWGLGSAFVFIGAFAIITGVTDQSNRGRWTGYMRAGQSMGFPTGLVVGGIVADVFDITTAFLAAGTLALAAGVLGWYVLPDVQPSGTDGRTPRLRDLPETVRSLPGVLPIGLANAGVRLLFGGVLLTTAVQYADYLGLTIGALTAAGVSGLVTGLGVVASAGATVVSGRVSDTVDSRAVVTLPGFALLAAGYALLALSGNLPGVTAGIVLVGAGTGAVGPALLATLGDIAPGDELGRLAGVYNVFGDIGLSVGPLAALPIAEAVGFTPTYLACAGVAVACLLLVNATLLKA
ncbi:MFS transporter [Halosegnis longus]|uniref:MFS transporter n=1 Tax=Halosegnis longus TaxID=2216012 RepID=A0AAJ4R916_9EURY|nr:MULTISPECIES: MFS transporter [Halobacteriales]RNJ26470.1 MFS transporter [Salella cibi]